jgi:protoheme IX farnesyltransferase
VFAGAVLLVAASLVPVLLGMGWVYALSAIAGGALLLAKAAALALQPDRRTAMASFHASLIQLTVVLVGGIVDAAARV